MKKNIILNVNGINREFIVEPSKRLLDVLRDELDLTGAKEGCDKIGECGACTVLMDGRPVLSCLILAVDAQEKEILTVEGLSTGVKLDIIQEEFINHGAFQCGYCTPGMIIIIKGFLDKNPDPSDEEIKDALKGNLCRCTGYTKIIEAVRDIIASRQDNKKEVV
ncbi:MAG: (2Fe-2S)-binding protein [Candidatus Methanofastidiosia archaeon]